MQLLTDNEIQREKWEDFIASNNFASPFQTPSFYEFINSVPNWSAKVFAIINNNQLRSLVVVILQKDKGIKGYFSYRGIIYGGPIYEADQPDALGLLLSSVYSLLKKEVIYLETRNFFDYSDVQYFFEENKWIYTPYLNFQMGVTDEKSLISAVSSSRLRQIRKAKQGGVTWREAAELEEVKSFHEILYTLYKRKVKKPLPPWKFFQNFFEKQIGKYLLVFFNGNIIGGIMCPILAGRSIYELYICGLDEKFKEQYPSIMATWAAVEYALQNQIPVFDFMGAGKPDEAYGVRDFKARFGGNLVEHGRFLNVTQPFLYRLGKAGLNLLAKLN